ncbi:cation:proton antiporter domain-containing protein [Uliginosibacterium aquaticum]|uniref:Cation:proton antiporter n=1 Tax=Uliginosibacterium aquaticum TaxID=2731212 RepID=A0ABX2IHY8_9RHOO|nr:cation:proton antiporter [Uliginosibacterium aquaticum]NSL53981.1 cation:proton antiporter [Uliginosibacterium aquaticum]
MNQSWAMVALSAVVLVAYLFDFLGRWIKVPAVVLLIFAGLCLRAVTDAFGLSLTPPDDLLPVLGTFGLILIVLEGALDLRLTREAAPLILRSSLCAVLGVVLTGAALTAALVFWLDAPLQAALVHALPLAVISSAVAIPAAAALAPRLREFVVYESSISDIVGVVLFYAMLNEFTGFGSMLVSLTGEITLSVFIGLVVGLLIFWLIQRIQHHVRVLPMIFGITLLYGLGKIMHLAPLVMVLLVGLLLNNYQLVRRFTGGRWQGEGDFESDLESFKHLTAEFTFVVRSFFFVLLGFGTGLAELLDLQAWLLAGIVLACSIAPRWALLRGVARESAEPLLWFAPRGLITVLLFLSIPAHLVIPAFPKAGLMLVILVWALLLSMGSLRIKPAAQDEVAPVESPPSSH